MSVEEFLRWEMGQEEYHELWRGEVRPRPASSMRHVRLTTDLTGILANELRLLDCENFGPLLLLMVRQSGSVFHPDGAIACPPNWHSREIGAIDNPTVLFEVTTPESEARDRDEKFEHYALLSSLRQYVLVSSEERKVESGVRQGNGTWTWTSYVDGDVVPLAVGIGLSVAELYEQTDL
jgi:Uma2 family endonuclease